MRYVSTTFGATLCTNIQYEICQDRIEQEVRPRCDHCVSAVNVTAKRNAIAMIPGKRRIKIPLARPSNPSRLEGARPPIANHVRNAKTKPTTSEQISQRFSGTMLARSDRNGKNSPEHGRMTRLWMAGDIVITRCGQHYEGSFGQLVSNALLVHIKFYFKWTRSRLIRGLSRPPYRLPNLFLRCTQRSLQVRHTSREG